MNSKLNYFILVFLFCFSGKAQNITQISPDSIEIKDSRITGLSIAKKYSNEKYGLIDTEGNIIVQFKYDYIYPFFDDLALVYNEDKCGFLNLEGNIAIPMEYTTGNHFKNGKAIMTKNFVYGVIDKSNNTVIPFEYDALRTHDHQIYSFQKESKKSGLMNKHEDIILEPTFDRLMPQNDSLWIGRKNSKFIILKNNGELHNQDTLDDLGRKNSCNLMRFKQNGKIGFLNEQFKTAIPAQYQSAGPVIGKIMSVFNGEKWGFIDKHNNPVTGFIYDKVKSLNKNNCEVVFNGQSKIVDQNGNIKPDFDCEYIKGINNSDLIYIDGHLYDKDFKKITTKKIQLSYGPFNGMENGMMKYYSNDKLGYVDSTGRVKINPLYDTGDHFYEENCTTVNKDGKWAFIRNDGEQITSFKYDSVYHYGSLMNCKYIVKENNLYGLFIKDKLAIKPQFEEIILGEDEGLIYRKGKRYGVLDVKLKKVYPAIYDSIISHVLGYEVVLNDKFGFLDKSMETVIPIEYDYLQHAGYFLIAKRNGKYGTISELNEIIQDFKYDKIEFKPFDIKRIINNGKIGLLASSGKELLPPIYDKISKIDWQNVEVTIDSKTEVINIFQLELNLETE